MQFARPLLRGRLVRRYKRFFADVMLDDGREVTAHCPNPGAMLGLVAPGLPVWVEPNDDPRRKLRFAWRLAEPEPGRWVGIDASLPNRVVAEGLAAGLAPALAGYDAFRPETRYGAASRVDFLAAGPGLPPAYVEVKNVHFCRTPGLAEFPDCVTARGAKHLRELAAMVAGGARSIMLYLVQRGDCDRMRVAADLDPAYAAAFAAARAAGVEAVAHRADVSPAGVAFGGEIPMVE
ncbi:DNA/RNA nuclease SfsA [Amaricoccus sp.]|uniref:DNA/RNA nuclease SfsA n=1 Tax=Amaricoccus sp. TaxID=1872485 RepID=UPI001B611904|nr:DNA/RNA nuclease SfsA [Amaricoccus sp.]MBP7241492.1 DNA/RNA nuclease SfsA [Amaricoccus sp.]